MNDATPATIARNIKSSSPEKEDPQKKGLPANEIQNSPVTAQAFAPEAAGSAKAEPQEHSSPAPCASATDRKTPVQNRGAWRRYAILAAAVVLALTCVLIALSVPKENEPPRLANTQATDFSEAATLLVSSSAAESTVPVTTEAPSVETTAAETIAVRNGYAICPVCRAIYSANYSCWYCTRTGQVELGRQCSGCGGYCGKTDASHTACNYCGTVYCPLIVAGYPYEAVHCSHCGECEFTESTGTTPHHCYQCGVCYLEASINQNGLCDVCGALPQCMICGHTGYDVYEGYCDDCCPFKAYCSMCGANVTYRGYITAEDGTIYCEDCWNTPYWEVPNVACPYCGYAFFTSGVGADGLDCPSCGESFYP